MPATQLFPVLAGVAAVAAVAAALLIVILRPLLVRYALARPNARSSHRVPTPQGGGIAILIPVLVFWLVFSRGEPWLSPTGAVLLGALVLAVLGGVDDIHPLPASLRLAVQAAAAFLAVGPGLPQGFHLWGLALTPMLSPLLLLGVVWFVNLYNFMDGLDWMAVSESAPVLAVLTVLFALDGDFFPALIAAALLGGFIGFAWFNKPVARLFLGDVGTLPIGLSLAWLLLVLADSGAPAAALLLPLYYVCDATLTLFIRLRAGKKVWEAHREHWYQRATDNGYPVLRVDATVFGLNMLLAALAVVSWACGGSPWSPVVDIVTLAMGFAAVAFVLRRFGRPVSS
ncbi:MAG: glycosyl transferase [Methylobacteriaceae bacterium]|jgi:UDP-N-acetylmuramyl pentapeptide phosphotransferase/UDP-N-acetylglucosamine-1-phosphate transferase|nr:glycosyl transferase [Methylobacteriaceae bacterium]